MDPSIPITADVIGPPLRWPPPGLESVHGHVWRAIACLAVGTGIMIAPMLLSIVMRQSIWSAGIGVGWWLPVLAALVGLLLLLAGLEQLTRILFDGVRAVRGGHDWLTVAYVVSDGRRDAGFLLQGARMYARIEERERRMLLAARVVAALGYAAALLWITLMFPLGIVAGSRGLLGSTGLMILVLLPPALLFIAAIVAHAFEWNTTRAATQAWHRSSADDVRLIDDVKEWRADRATRVINLTAASHKVVPARVGAIALIVLAVLLPLPITTLALASAIGPVLTQLAAPRLDSSAARVAKAAMLAPYALPANETMTPLEAGEALHAVALMGAYDRRSRIEREPVRRFDAWPRESKPESFPSIESFGTELMPRARALNADEIRYLERVAEHPAHAEVSRLARVRSADIAGGRWNIEMLETVPLYELPVSRFAGLHDAAHFHTARAVLELARGNAAAAETTLREVISLGLLITNDSPTLIDALVGTSIVVSGAAALQSFYQTVGRTADADALRRPNEGIDAMSDIVRALRSDDDNDKGLRRAMQMTTNESLPRGMRWEALIAIQAGASCLDPHTIVFGHGSEYTGWLEQSRESLVRYPAEDVLFRRALVERMLPRELQARAGIVERVFALTLGRDPAAGTCAALLTGLTSSR